MMKTVGFIGLGIMGLPMAGNLIKKGFPLIVYNRTPGKADELLNLGADLAATPAEAARACDVLITMLSDDMALQEVFYGQDGVMEGIRLGLTVIDCSTVSPETSRKLNKELAGHYADFLDAPVTGSKPGAVDGTLTFMVGGSREAFVENLPLFQAMGEKIVYMGPSGAGSQTKLAHNTISAINMSALAEGLAIASKSGIDPERFMEVLLNGGASSKIAASKGPRILERNFTPQFPLQLMLKDIRLASSLSSSLQLPVPMLEAAKSIFQIADSKGLGASDMAAVVQCYEEWSGTEIHSNPPQESKSSDSERRRSIRIPLGIKIKLSIYQWEQEGSFSGQLIDGTLHDLSDSGLLIYSEFLLARDMFIVLHFPQEAELPPIIAKIIRIETKHDGVFHYGCMLSGIPPYTQIKLESYIHAHIAQQV